MVTHKPDTPSRLTNGMIYALIVCGTLAVLGLLDFLARVIDK